MLKSVWYHLEFIQINKALVYLVMSKSALTHWITEKLYFFLGQNQPILSEINLAPVSQDYFSVSENYEAMESR